MLTYGVASFSLSPAVAQTRSGMALKRGAQQQVRGHNISLNTARNEVKVARQGPYVSLDDFQKVYYRQTAQNAETLAPNWPAITRPKFETDFKQLSLPDRKTEALRLLDALYLKEQSRKKTSRPSRQAKNGNYARLLQVKGNPLLQHILTWVEEKSLRKTLFSGLKEYVLETKKAEPLVVAQRAAEVVEALHRLEAPFSRKDIAFFTKKADGVQINLDA